MEAKNNLNDNYVFAGYTTSNDGDVIGYHGPFNIPGPEGDAWIASGNSYGIAWQKCLGGSGDDGANCIIRTSDGGYAVCGWTSSHDGDFSDNQNTVYGDAWIARFDENGVLLWEKCFGGGASASSIIEVRDEGRDLVVAGIGICDSANQIDQNVWIMRVSSDGKTIRWQKCYGGTGTDRGYSIIQTKDNGFAIAGLTNSKDGDVKGYHASESFDEWILKLDVSGNMQWQKCLGGTGNDIANSIIETSDGGYIIAGTTTSPDGDVTGWHPSFLLIHDDAWIVKLSSSGALQWQKCFGGSGEDGAYSIIQTSDGDFIMAGSTASNDGDLTRKKNVNSNAWIVRLNDTGAIKWQKWYGGTGGDQAFSIIKTSDSGYVFAGSTGSNDGDVSGNHDSVLRKYGDVWVVKLDPDTGKASVEVNFSTSFAQEYVKVYPNPSSAEVHFSAASNLSLNTIGFYDVMGRQLFPKYSLENNLVSCDVHDFPSGIYLARLGWTSGMTWRDGVYPGSFTMPFLVQH